MSILKGNQLYNRNSILSLRKSSTDIDFNVGMQSIDLAECNFTNYLSSSESKEYKKVKYYYDKSLAKNNDFLDTDFEFSGYTNKNTFKNEKIKKLIYETSNTVFSDMDLIDLIKYKNKSLNGVQFFIKYDKKTSKGIVYLIDLYHMAIHTDLFYRGSTIKTSDKEYYNRISKKVKHNVSLSNML